MSSWTHVNGLIHIDTYCRSTAKAVCLAQTVIDHLPRITGSEGPAELYLIRPNGYCYSSLVDEFDQRSNLGERKYPSKVSWFREQSRMLIAVSGDLRDRQLSQTVREVAKMLNRLSSRLTVRECTVMVRDWRSQYVFANPDWVLNNEFNYEWRDKVFGVLK